MSRSLDPLALPLHGSRLIEASAGTGKTYTIAALYVRLVLGHGDERTAFAGPLPPSRILVMTFTVAATRELSERIRERLVDAARCFRGERTVVEPLVERLMADYPPGPARVQAAWRLATAAEAMDDAAVVTIDAWVQRMLREHAFDSGSVFDETLEPDPDAMLSEAARDYWRQQIYPLTGAALDDAAAIWPKVEALVEDARRLTTKIDEVDDDRSLARVRDEAVAARRVVLERWKEGWLERFEAMRDWLTARMDLKTRGPFKPGKPGAKYVDDWFGKLIGWAADVDRVDFGISKAARSRLTPAGLADCAKEPATFTLPPAFREFAGLDVPVDLVAPAPAMRLHAARHIKRRILALKHDAGIFGFQDQLERLDRALAGPRGERLRQRIVTQFPAALIDEFQDTSPLQYRIFDRLYRVAADDPSTALLLIGDPKQSIYAFRGADINSYLRARAATDGRHARLTTNYRSTTGLVEAINRLFVEAEAYPEGAFRLETGPDRPLPFVPVDAQGLPCTYVATDGPVAPVTIVHDIEISPKPEVQQRFAERCAEHVATTLADPRAGFVAVDGTFTRVRPADIAVLVRDRREAAAVRHALQRRRIASAYLSDQESVFASAEAGDLLPWLRAVAAPLDGRLARAAFATRLIGLSIPAMRELAIDERCFETRVEQLRRLHVEWREQGVLSMLRRTLHLLDLPARWLMAADGERRLTNVLHLAELLQAASAKLDGEEALIRWFGERLADDRKRSDEEIVRLESDADLVRVVTVHKSKGLEYSIVYLPFATSVRDLSKKSGEVAWLSDAAGTRHLIFDIDVAVRARMELEAKQEELRLLYVAVTRARHALWLGVAPPRSYGDGQFHRSALGYLLTGENAIDAAGIPRVLHDRFGDLASVRLVVGEAGTPSTPLAADADVAPLIDAPAYTGTFERDWSIGSFSSLVRGLPRLALAAAIVDPAIEEEMLEEPDDASVVVVSSAISSAAARHRFPRGAFAGNFLHAQLEWLADQRFALDDPAVAQELVARCARQGWGARADDVVTWLGEVATTPLLPVDVALAGMTTLLPEMEFWFPSERVETRQVDALCTTRLLSGRPRPPLPTRALRGMLMGFMDLVFESGGRYWLLDYKSNALGDDDRAYTADALEAAMAAHRYDVQGAIYLLALHRLLGQRLGDAYDPRRQLGGAIYLFMRGIRAPTRGCFVLSPEPDFIESLDEALRTDATATA